MKTFIHSLSLIAIILVGFSACNKTKRNSNRFIKAGEWSVTELSVNGTNEDELPSWHIKDCEIYETSCFAEWENPEGGHAEFIWQFRDKGKTFEISHQAEADEGEEHDHDHDHDHASQEAASQAYAFSGVYEVTEDKKDMMQFETTSAIGYQGETVLIKIEKK